MTATSLPVYVLPRNVRILMRFPLNANGKYDRKALQMILENALQPRRCRAAAAVTARII
jgi:hypothetical protein